MCEIFTKKTTGSELHVTSVTIHSANDLPITAQKSLLRPPTNSTTIATDLPVLPKKIYRVPPSDFQGVYEVGGSNGNIGLKHLWKDVLIKRCLRRS